MWLLLDTTIHADLQSALESRGVRCVHAGLEGLGAADAARLLQAALEDECVLVTRNYAGFTELADAYRTAGRGVPPLLFVSPELAMRVDAQADAIAEWLEVEEPRPGSGRTAWVGSRARKPGRSSGTASGSGAPAGTTAEPAGTTGAGPHA